MMRAVSVLVIKHGALGDFVLALGAMQAIRTAHAGAKLVLLTSPAMREIAEGSGLFDEILWDDRAPLHHVAENWRMVRSLRQARFSQVYDLQESDRTWCYLRLLGIRDCRSDRRRHPCDRWAEKLHRRGIGAVGAACVNLRPTSPRNFSLPRRYVLLLPGSSISGQRKRFPPSLFAGLAELLQGRGIGSVLAGAAADRQACADVQAAAPYCHDLCGRTNLADLLALGRTAAGIVGNDSGAIHLLAAAGLPVVALFGPASDAAQSAPRGARVVVHHERDPSAARASEIVLRLDEVTA